MFNDFNAYAGCFYPCLAVRRGDLTMPSLVLWGEEDALVPLAVGRALADSLPRARFHVLKNCGHLPTLEKPKESAARFSELLQEVVTRGR